MLLSKVCSIPYPLFLFKFHCFKTFISKGTVFDVSHKSDVYGPGMSYSIFAGKDGSKGLGMSSLKPEDAVSDYSGLPEAEMQVLNDWHGFFS
jgi:membrane-associated progesterone receptor component